MHVCKKDLHKINDSKYKKRITIGNPHQANVRIISLKLHPNAVITLKASAHISCLTA